MSEIIRIYESSECVIEVGAGERVALKFIVDARGDSDIKFRVIIRHTGNDSESNIECVGVARDTSKIEFATSLDVAPNVANVSANQMSRILILGGGQGRVEPFQTIRAEKVKAYHGAAVGGVREDELFALHLAGIARAEAENLIAEGLLSSDL